MAAKTKTKPKETESLTVSIVEETEDLTIETAEVATDEVSDTKTATEEITLAENYKGHNSLIFNSFIIDFSGGKAVVLKETAEKLREQGFIQ